MAYEHGVDLMLLRRAIENSVQPKGLETAAEQLEGFLTAPADIVRSAFAMALDHPERFVQSRDLIIEGFIHGDMTLIDAARAKSYQTFPQVAEKIFDQRERRWGQKIVASAKSGTPTAIVVGASHLAAVSPLWAFLKQQGYEVDRFPGSI